APGLPAHPSISLEIVRSRGNDIRHGVDHVAAAVAVEVDGIALERGRHELRRTEGARPRSLEVIRAHVTAREDFQRGKKLLAEIIAAAPDTGERRRRADDRAVAD